MRNSKKGYLHPLIEQASLTLAWNLSFSDDYFCSVLIYITSELHEEFPNPNDALHRIVGKLKTIEVLKHHPNIESFAAFLINDGAFEIVMLRELN